MGRITEFFYRVHVCGYCHQNVKCWIKPAGKVDTHSGSTAFYTAVCRDCLIECVEGFGEGEYRAREIKGTAIALPAHASVWEDTDDDD